MATNADITAIDQTYNDILTRLANESSEMSTSKSQVVDIQSDVASHYQSDGAAPVFASKIQNWLDLYGRYQTKVNQLHDGTQRAKQFIDQHADLATQLAQGVPIGDLMGGQ